MLDNDRDKSDYNITANKMEPNYWTNKLLTWWSGFSSVSYTHLTLPTILLV